MEPESGRVLRLFCYASSDTKNITLYNKHMVPWIKLMLKRADASLFCSPDSFRRPTENEIVLQKGCLNAPINTICTEIEHAGRCRDILGTPKSATQGSFHPLGILMQTTLQYVQLVVGASLHQVMSCKDVTTTQAPAAAHRSHQRLLLLILLVTKSKRALSNFIPH